MRRTTQPTRISRERKGHDMFTTQPATGTRTRYRHPVIFLAAGVLFAVAVGLYVAPQSATAAGGSTFINSASVTTPQVGKVVSTITVSGQPTLTDVNVALNGISHVTGPDVDVLLEGPTGVRVMLLSDVDNAAGDAGDPFGPITLAFDDASPGQVPIDTQLVSGFFRPTDVDNNLASPDGDTVVPATTGATLAAFNGTNPNGVWTLHFGDDSDDIGPSDTGTLAGGWTLELRPSPADVTCHGQPATQVGTEGADTLVGTKKRDVIVGLGGDDQIVGKKGNDLLCGGEGNDTLIGGKGNDQLSGGAGTDSCNGGGGKERVIEGCEVQRKIP